MTSAIESESVLTCPRCGFAKRETMPTDACQFYYQCDGCKAVLLETAVDNAAALGFYKRHGYAVLETIPRYYLDSVDALVMGKHLTKSAKA